MRAWLQEPLTRFLLLGAVLFTADALLNDGTREASSERIVVTASQQQALRQAFRAEHRRDPEPEELQAQLDRWIEEQLLYREAIALGLDRKDAIVQRQLTQKMRFLLEDAAPLAEPRDTDLQAWLEQHPERYGHAPTVSFQQVFLSRGRHGEQLVAEAQRAAEQLSREPETWVGLGDPFLVGQQLQDADADRLRRDFGPEIASAVEQLKAGKWSAPIASGFGLHLLRVTARKPFQPAQLANVIERVRVDLKLSRREEANRQAMQRLRQRYEVEVEPVTEASG